MDGPSQFGGCTANLESALEAKKLELQTLPCLATENTTLRTEVIRLQASVETLDREKRKIAMVAQNVPDLTRNAEKIRAS